VKILAVDDSPDNIQLIVDIIGDMGYEVLKAYKGLDALSIVQSEQPDLILLDINMPGMSGFEVLNILKLDPLTATIPVILLTALSDVDYRVEGFDLGAEDYLMKPFSPLELIARIEARLRNKATTDGLRNAQQVIRQTFERFVAPSVVEQLLKDPQNVQLGGKLQDVTVMFADIEGFTRISEHTPPEVLLTILNQYHQLVVDMVQYNGGTIDKFMGDAVMSIFNSPLQQPDHVARAVRSACQIINHLPAFHERFVPDFQLKINFGIHTGQAVIGNVGTPQMMDYTAVGDTVNVTARLQEAAQGGRILVSDAVYQVVSDQFKGVSSEMRQLKGRSVPVKTYYITCE
jgi:adenylate cyclase